MLVWVLEQNPAVRCYEDLGGQLVTSKEIEIGGIFLRKRAVCLAQLITYFVEGDGLQPVRKLNVMDGGFSL